MFFFFFKQKTAYEMRISDWSSDVCSSDLQSLAYRLRKYASRHRWALVSGTLVAATLAAALGIVLWQSRQFVQEGARAQALKDFVVGLFEKIGRASCRERVWPYV